MVAGGYDGLPWRRAGQQWWLRLPVAIKKGGTIFCEIGRPAWLCDGGHITTNSADATASPPGCHMHMQ